jgi:hypothetical protein
MEYNFYADLLNKYSQITPWVQALISLSFTGMVVAVAYFCKESVTAVMKPFIKDYDKADKEKKPEWQDKYYRGE